MINIITVVIEDYTRKVYLATFSDSNTGDFCLDMTRISKKIRAKTFWTLPNIAQNQDGLTTISILTAISKATSLVLHAGHEMNSKHIWESSVRKIKRSRSMSS